MTKLTLTEQKELFARDCKLINLKYEYNGYTGKEKWAIITELKEAELLLKYPDVARRYIPFVLLSVAQGEVITEYQNVEARERMRKLRYGHVFDISDGEFEEHNPSLAIEDDVVERLYWREKVQIINRAIATLTDIQQRRIVAYFFEDKTIRDIAIEEDVNYSKVEKSINLALKKLKKFLS